MERKRRSPLRGPLVTLALMVGSVAAVVAVANAIDARQKAPQATASAPGANGSAGQTAVRPASDAGASIPDTPARGIFR